MCYGPSGDAYFLCAVNSAVHVVMYAREVSLVPKAPIQGCMLITSLPLRRYSYYFVTSAGKLKVPQGVKRAITVLQLTQFASFIIGV